MNVESLRLYCISKKGVEETFPFDDTTLVFKVMGKMFALIPLESEDARINLKCDPDRAIELREEYPDWVLPGYHMSKTHWNTVIADDRLPHTLIIEWIDHSYELVVASLTKKLREEWKQLPDH